MHTTLCSDRLKKLKMNGRLVIKAESCTVSIIQGYYRAARKLGIKISIRNTPDGMRLWRIK